MFSQLYITEIRLDKEIPSHNYLTRLPVINYLGQTDGIKLTSNVTFLVGENGLGKSTLIEAIAIAMGFNPEGGTRNFNFHTNDSYSDLSEYLTVCKGIRRAKDGFFLRAESYYNFASNIDELDSGLEPELRLINSYGGVSLHRQSHGESFMSMVENRLGGHGLYIFDEPEAALSPSKLLQLMCHIDRLIKDDSQFIIATHSPILMAFPGADVLELTESGISSVNYKDTDHFNITKRFLNSPEKFFSEMFK